MPLIINMVSRKVHRSEIGCAIWIPKSPNREDAIRRRGIRKKPCLDMASRVDRNP